MGDRELMSIDIHLRYPVEVRNPAVINFLAPELEYGGPRTEGHSAAKAKVVAALATVFPEAYSGLYRSGLAK